MTLRPAEGAAWPALAGHRYMNLTTYRKSGQAVTAPVWFAQENDKLYVVTLAGAGKVKRLRNSGRVACAPSTAGGQSRGPVAAGTARLLSAAEAPVADRALTRKYGWQKHGFMLLWRLTRGRPLFLEIVPA